LNMPTRLSILLLAVLHLTCGFDLSAYKQQYQTQVGAPYKQAVTIAANDIIEYLAVSPVPTTSDAGRQVVQLLTTKTQALSSNLDSASLASDDLREQLDDEVEQLVSQASGVQQQIAADDQCLQATNSRLVESNAQLTEAQNQVNRAQESVRNAQNTLAEENRRVDDAKHCTGIGLFDFVCPIINHDGIRHAEGDRDRAQNELNNQQQRLTGIQQQQAQYVASQTKLQQSKANFDTIKANLNVQLNQLNQARDNVVNVDTILKAFIMHLDTLLGKSVVLGEVVKDLIDMETVVKPLMAIADQIIGFTSNTDDVAYMNTMKQKISSSIVLVQQKLPQYALIPPVPVAFS